MKQLWVVTGAHQSEHQTNPQVSFIKVIFKEVVHHQYACSCEQDGEHSKAQQAGIRKNIYKSSTNKPRQPIHEVILYRTRIIEELLVKSCSETFIEEVEPLEHKDNLVKYNQEEKALYAHIFN